jgi:hypothetical protein
MVIKTIAHCCLKIKRRSRVWCCGEHSLWMHLALHSSSWFTCRFQVIILWSSS